VVWDLEMGTRRRILGGFTEVLFVGLVGWLRWGRADRPAILVSSL